MTLRKIALLALAALPGSAFGADSALLSLINPDSKVVAGVQVDTTKNSSFGQYVLAHMQADNQDFTGFVAKTGFDPRRDLNEMILASNWQKNTPDSRWLIAARGTFSPDKITALAQANGSTLTNFGSVQVVTGIGKTGGNGPQSAFAFLDSSTAVMGDLQSVQAAIQRRQSGAPIDAGLLTKVGAVDANDFWFATLVPISEFAAAVPDANVQGAMKGNLVQGISQAVGGIKFGTPLTTVSAQATTRSAKDAQALIDVIQFLAGLVQQNKSATVASLADSIKLTSSGSLVSMTLPITDAQLQQLLDTAKVGMAAQSHQKAPVTH